MAATARAFFIGVATTVIIAGMAFGGGLFFAKQIMEQPSSASLRRTEASQLPPARVILPASAETARPAEAIAAPQQTTPATVSQMVTAQESEPKLAVTPESQPAPERDKAAERAERRKAELEEREQQRRAAARKARREAARLAKRQQRQEQHEPRIMAFGGDSDQPQQKFDLFGN